MVARAVHRLGHPGGGRKDRLPRGRRDQRSRLGVRPGRGHRATRWTADTGAVFEPQHLALSGGRLIVPTVGNTDGQLLALDPATGRRLWTSPLTPGVRTDWSYPPNVAGGRIYLGGGNSRIYSIDAATGRVVWRSFLSGTGSGWGPPAVVGNRVYASDGGAVYAAGSVGQVARFSLPGG